MNRADIDPAGSPSKALFVGREREMALLRSGLGDALGGCGGLFLVAGEPGVGKTRVANELGRSASGLGARVLWGRCWEGEGAPPFWPWVQVLRACFSGEGGSSSGPGLAELLDDLLPDERRPGSSGGDPPRSPDSEHARFYLFDRVTNVLRTAAEATPLVLVLDDLQWADEPSLRLLEFLAPSLRESRILAVGTYRDSEVARVERLADRIDALARQAHHVSLHGLDAREVRLFIEGAAGWKAEDELVATMHQATGGNPFFLEQILRELPAEPGRGAPLRVPGGVRAVIRRRLSPLSSECGALLAVAAVIGREFDVRALEEASRVSSAPLLAALDEAQAAGIVIGEDRASGRYAFSHDLVRESLYGGLPARRRLEIHHDVALALERLYGASAEPPLAELARHFLQAAFIAGPLEAVDYARRAARHSMSALAYEDAARLLEQALDVRRRAGHGEDAELCGLLLEQGDALDRAGERQRARGAYGRAAEIARRLGASRELGRAALGVGGRGYSDIGVVDTALVDLLEEALAALGDQDSALRAELLARLAEELGSSFTPAVRERGEALAREAVDAARRSGRSAALVKALHASFFLLSGPDTLAALLDLTAEMVAVAEKTGDGDMEFKARFRRIITLFETEDVAAIDSEVAGLKNLAEKLREPNHRWNLLELHTVLAFLDGRFEDAERLAREGFALGGQLRKVDASPIFTGQILALRKAQRRSGEMEAAIAAEIERFPEIPYWRLERALVRCEIGRHAEARADLEQIAGADFRDLPKNFLWLGSLAVVAQVAARLGDGRRARLLYEMLLPYAGRPVAVGISWYFGSADRYLGLLAETSGDLDAAVGHLESALAANARVRARPLVVETSVDCVRVLLGRDLPGDRERAAELLEQALATARGLGLEALETKLAERSEGGAAAPRSTPPSNAPERGVFRREADYWTIGCGGRKHRLRDMKGLGIVARLLRHPEQEFHALDLMAEGGVRTGAVESDAGEQLDVQARSEYRGRLVDLREELAEAEAFEDLGRIEKIRNEIEALSQELSRAVGLGGRSRAAGSNAERARLAVRASITAAIRRLTALDAGLGHYLSTTIRTGAFCGYTPDPRHPIDWDL